jgi:hypothetical protein
MCCLVTSLFLLGPRVAIVLWWLMQPVRWQAAFGSFLWPLLGFVFLPFTTLMWVLVIPGGITGFDWLWIALAVFIDVAGYGGGTYGNRDRIPGYSS